MPTQDVLARLQQNYSELPALIAIIAGVETFRWSFADLQQAILYCQQVLQGSGAVAGDSVLLVSGDLPQLVALVFASLNLQLSLIPLHVDHDARILATVIANNKPRLCIIEAGLLETASVSWYAPGGQVLVLQARAQNWLCPLPTDKPLVACATLAPDIKNPKPGSALIFHSSGTTGQAKALHYSKAQLNTFLYWQQVLFANFQDDPFSSNTALSPRINTLPLVHWGGLSFCLQALLEHRCVYLLRNFTALSVLGLIRKSACQLLLLIPAMYREMLGLLQQEPAPASLRYCLTMGEAMAPGLSHALHHKAKIKLYTAYGMSEALCGLAHGSEPWEQMPEGNCGRHAFGELKLVDEQGNTVADEGELWVRNATTTPCYIDADLLQQKYVQGWYRTGDRLARDSKGYYFFRGRVDGMCVHNGRNVYPQQLEAVFILHEDVQGCIAAPIVIQTGSRRLAIMLATCSALLPTKTSLMNFYLEHGAMYAAPVYILWQAGLPCNATGKPDRLKVQTLLQQAYDTELTAVNSGSGPDSVAVPTDVA